jgi:hypothetical protein
MPMEQTTLKEDTLTTNASSLDQAVDLDQEAKKDEGEVKVSKIISLLGGELEYDEPQKRMVARLVQVYYHFTQKDLKASLDKQNAQTLLQYIFSTANEGDVHEFENLTTKFTKKLMAEKQWRKKFGIDGFNLPRKFFDKKPPSYFNSLKREGFSSMLEQLVKTTVK